jgi:Uncharacterised conserved protein
MALRPDSVEPFMIECIKQIGEILLANQTSSDESQSLKDTNAFFEYFINEQVGDTLLQVLSMGNPNTTVRVLCLCDLLVHNVVLQEARSNLFESGWLDRLLLFPLDLRQEETAAYFLSLMKTIATKQSPTQIHTYLLTDSFPLLEASLDYMDHYDALFRTTARNILLILSSKALKEPPYVFESLSHKLQRTLHALLSTLFDPSLALESRTSLLLEHTNLIYFMNDLFSLSQPSLDHCLLMCIEGLFSFYTRWTSLLTTPHSYEDTNQLFSLSLFLFCHLLVVCPRRDLCEMFMDHIAGHYPLLSYEHALLQMISSKDTIPFSCRSLTLFLLICQSPVTSNHEQWEAIKTCLLSLKNESDSKCMCMFLNKLYDLVSTLPFDSWSHVLRVIESFFSNDETMIYLIGSGKDDDEKAGARRSCHP